MIHILKPVPLFLTYLVTYKGHIMDDTIKFNDKVIIHYHENAKEARFKAYNGQGKYTTFRVVKIPENASKNVIKRVVAVAAKGVYTHYFKAYDALMVALQGK